MGKGLIRVIGLALAWAFIYALPAVPIEGLANLGIEFSFTYAVDMWPAELGLPGFIGGLFFAALLVLTGQLGRFERLPSSRLAAWGTLAGLLLAGLYVTQVWPEPGSVIALIVVIATVLGALAAPGSAALFRVVASRRGAAAGARV